MIKKVVDFFAPEGKTQKQKNGLFLFTVCLFLFALVSLGIMGLYFSAGTYKIPLFLYYLEQPKLIVLNVLPYVLLGVLVWLLTNHPWIGFLTPGVVCLIYSFSNYWKLVSRDDPLLAEDITLIKEALQMSGAYVQVTWQMCLAVILVVVGTIILAITCRTKIKSLFLRMVFVVVVILSCIPLYTKVYNSGDLYGSFVVWEELNQWFDNNRFISRGGIYPFIYSISSAIPNPPADYKAENARAMLTAYETDVIPEEKKVNVMVVMYEAFSDLSKYTDMITGVDPYEAFHRLQDESYHGELVTNIFAGGTINSERSVLTGFSYLSNFRKPSWSYARYFSDMGYVVDGSHAGFQAFYNRINVNRNLGIPVYRFIENYFNELVESVPMDDVFLPEISRIFMEEITKGNNVFSFNVTYQNHGPYETVTIPWADEYVPSEKLSDDDYGIINNYLRGIEETGEYMYQLAEQYRDIDEPVVFVFFGDHKPWLGEYSSTYTALGIDIFEETEESFYNHYNTEYLIWANESAKKVLDNEFIGIGPDISPQYLMNVLFEQCGWEGPDYMKLSNVVMKKLPVVTTNNYVIQDEKLIENKYLTEENKQMLKEFEHVQYYLQKEYYKDNKK